MTIESPKFIEQLMNARGNRLVKIVTGIRRCGKSFLLNELFRKRLQKKEIKKTNTHSVWTFPSYVRRQRCFDNRAFPIFDQPEYH